MLLWALGCDGGDDSAAGPGPGGDTAEDTAGAPALEVRLVSPEEGTAWDECGEICFVAEAVRGGQPAEGVTVDLEVEGHGFVGADVVTDAAGRAEACASGLPPGVHTVAASATGEVGEHVRAWGTVDVRPFGWDLGLDLPADALATLPWTPAFTKSTSNPVLAPGAEGEWDAAGTLLPTVWADGGGWAMYYAGTSEADYIVGAATSDDGLAWTKAAGNPVFPASATDTWKLYSTNSPMLLHDGTEWLLYYTGRATETGELSVGLATGADPLALTDVPENPVLPWQATDNDWAGSAVAHPSVLVRDGVYQAWYSGGRHKVGYALSTDGRTWTRYCHNPVFEGSAADWEMNQVKSTEVVWRDPYYMMTYTGGATGSFQVGWAMSTDGVRWVRAEEPVIAPAEEGGTWESASVIGATLWVDEAAGLLRTWYGGTGMDTSAIGYAEATLP